MLKRVLIAPDSFKGTLSAEEICEIEREVLVRHFPQAVIDCVPLADGGEGMVQAFLRLAGGKRVEIPVTGPDGRTVMAAYGLLDEKTAVIEMAACAGLPLMGDHPDPLHATTCGVGEMLLDAAARGVKKVILGLGGSATNDCGVGMAAALGFRFFDAEDCPVTPQACMLGQIARIEIPEKLPEIEIEAACDVDNPLLGEHGATYTFGPQKGAKEQELQLLERGMTHFAQVLEETYGEKLSDCAGTGAAGGMGMAVRQFLGGRLRSGIELLLDAADFDRRVRASDLVLTGEGRIDSQSAHGKVISGVAARCKKYGVPCVALCGSIGEGAEELYAHGLTAIFSAVNRAAAFDEVRRRSAADLRQLTDAVARLLAVQQKN